MFSANDQVGEADVLLLLSDGTTLPVEIKRHASGFRAGDLQRLEQIADRMSGIGTVLACGDDRAATGLQFAGLERSGPMPRRLITADEWLAPYAPMAIGYDGPGSSRDENAADAFDEQFSADIIAAQPGGRAMADPVADRLLPRNEER